MWSVRYFCSILTNFGVSQHILIKVSGIKFHQNSSTGSCAEKCQRTEGQTDWLTWRIRQAFIAIMRTGLLLLLLLLGAFTKFRQATIRFVISVCPSAWTPRFPPGRIFMKFNIWVFFENPSTRLKFHSNPTRIRGTFHEDQRTLMIISRRILLRMRSVSDKDCRHIQYTHFTFNNFFPNLLPFTR
jgi:hypothetical protein